MEELKKILSTIPASELTPGRISQLMQQNPKLAQLYQEAVQNPNSLSAAIFESEILTNPELPLETRNAFGVASKELGDINNQATFENVNESTSQARARQVAEGKAAIGASPRSWRSDMERLGVSALKKSGQKFGNSHVTTDTKGRVLKDSGRKNILDGDASWVFDSKGRPSHQSSFDRGESQRLMRYQTKAGFTPDSPRQPGTNELKDNGIKRRIREALESYLGPNSLKQTGVELGGNELAGDATGRGPKLTDQQRLTGGSTMMTDTGFSKGKDPLMGLLTKHGVTEGKMMIDPTEAIDKVVDGLMEEVDKASGFTPEFADVRNEAMKASVKKRYLNLMTSRNTEGKIVPNASAAERSFAENLRMAIKPAVSQAYKKSNTLTPNKQLAADVKAFRETARNFKYLVENHGAADGVPYWFNTIRKYDKKQIPVKELLNDPEKLEEFRNKHFIDENRLRQGVFTNNKGQQVLEYIDTQASFNSVEDLAVFIKNNIDNPLIYTAGDSKDGRVLFDMINGLREKIATNPHRYKEVVPLMGEIMRDFTQYRPLIMGEVGYDRVGLVRNPETNEFVEVKNLKNSRVRQKIADQLSTEQLNALDLDNDTRMHNDLNMKGSGLDPDALTQRGGFDWPYIQTKPYVGKPGQVTEKLNPDEVRNITKVETELNRGALSPSQTQKQFTKQAPDGSIVPRYPVDPEVTKNIIRASENPQQALKSFGDDIVVDMFKSSGVNMNRAIDKPEKLLGYIGADIVETTPVMTNTVPDPIPASGTEAAQMNESMKNRFRDEIFKKGPVYQAEMGAQERTIDARKSVNQALGIDNIEQNLPRQSRDQIIDAQQRRLDQAQGRVSAVQNEYVDPRTIAGKQGNVTRKLNSLGFEGTNSANPDTRIEYNDPNQMNRRIEVLQEQLQQTANNVDLSPAQRRMQRVKLVNEINQIKKIRDNADRMASNPAEYGLQNELDIQAAEANVGRQQERLEQAQLRGETSPVMVPRAKAAQQIIGSYDGNLDRMFEAVEQVVPGAGNIDGVLQLAGNDVSPELIQDLRKRYAPNMMDVSMETTEQMRDVKRNVAGREGKAVRELFPQIPMSNTSERIPMKGVAPTRSSMADFARKGAIWTLPFAATAAAAQHVRDGNYGDAAKTAAGFGGAMAVDSGADMATTSLTQRLLSGAGNVAGRIASGVGAGVGGAAADYFIHGNTPFSEDVSSPERAYRLSDIGLPAAGAMLGGVPGMMLGVGASMGIQGIESAERSNHPKYYYNQAEPTKQTHDPQQAMRDSVLNEMLPRRL